MRADDAKPPVPTLERQVDPTAPLLRRRGRAAIWIIAMSLSIIAGSVGLLARTVSGPTPPAAIARADVDFHGAQPPPTFWAADEPIGDPVDRLPDAAPMRAGVAAAADRHGVIAVWTDRVVWVSRDDGRSFHQELAAPGPLTAVAVGVDGRVFAARHGGPLDMVAPGEPRRRLHIGGAQVLAIDAGSPWLAALVLHRDSADGLSPMLWLSDDLGLTWRRQVVPHHGNTDNRIQVSPDGVIDLMTMDGDTDGGRRVGHYRGSVDGSPFQLLYASDDEQPFGLDHRGESWQLDRSGRMRRLVGKDAPALPVRSWDVRLASSRGRTLAVTDGHLVDLHAGLELTRHLPGRVDAFAVDGLGRALATVGGSAVRYSPLHGWRRLFEVPRR